MKDNLGRMLEKTYQLFNMIDAHAGIMKKAGAKGQLCDILKFELLSFLCCLSASDGRISRVEAQLVREYFGLEMYPIHIKSFIGEHNIGSVSYFRKVPESLKIAVKVDNYIAEHGSGADKGVSDLVIEVFKLFGKEMVVADEKVKAEEQMAWSKYITMMTRYATQRSVIYQQNPQNVPRPGSPIEVDYEMSLNKIGRIYTLYIGKLDENNEHGK